MIKNLVKALRVNKNGMARSKSQLMIPDEVIANREAQHETISLRLHVRDVNWGIPRMEVTICYLQW